MDLLKFQMGMSVNHVVWRAIHIFVLDGYVNYPYAVTRYDGRPITDFRIDLDIRMLSFSQQLETPIIDIN